MQTSFTDYLEISFLIPGRGEPFSVIVAAGQAFQGSFGPAWANDLADRIAQSDWLVNGMAGGATVTVDSIKSFGQGIDIPVT